ncbi:MAG: DNA polymerase/3'-5' exonuclease PolX [Gemmatimonadetes bacterium]|nr:DNA polymerase/3'-5' exonuclease PolX [Gemmatimonadota bacterium]
MTNKQIGKVLSQIGSLLILQGESTFKTRAYANAARRVETLSEPVEDMVHEDRLGKVPGLGASMVRHITELVRVGQSSYHQSLVKTVPAGFQEMLTISGLGAKKIRTIHDHLGIDSVGELEYACMENRLVKLNGFGAKTQERVLKGIDLIKRSRGFHRLDRALKEAKSLADDLLRHPDVWRVEIAGDVRRRMEVISEIDLVVSHPDRDRIMAILHRFGQVQAEDGQDLTVIGPTGLPVRVHCVPDETFAVTLYHWTGSDGHRTRVARHADDRGITITDRHVIHDRTVIPCPDESAIYDLLGLQFVPPELREGGEEIARASENRLPKLPVRSDIQGVIHNHTSYSDGMHSLREMAEGARARGFGYIAVCDHSRTAAYAHGLSIERVLEQQEEIDALNAQYDDFRILKGIESDILPDGSLDYPNEVLASFDLVVASVHSMFNMSEADMTERMVKAIRNPHTTILGHPTGRLLLARDGYPVDVVRLIDEAVANDVAIEVNANPHRLDLDWRHLEYGMTRGARFSIGPDAHHVDELDYVDYGLYMVRKGGVTPDRLLNTLTAEELIRLKTVNLSTAAS